MRESLLWASVLCLAGSVIIGGIALKILLFLYAKPMTYNAWWLWSLGGCVTCVFPIVAGASGVIASRLKSARVLRATQLLAFIGAAAMIAQLVVGVFVAARAWEFGAEAKTTSLLDVNWKIVNAAIVFGICGIPPTFIGALTVSMSRKLAKLRRMDTE